MERTNFEKRINMWSNTLKNKSDTLRDVSGFTLVIAMIVFTSVYAFSEYTFKDIPIMLLLVYSLIGCKPYIEVAQVKNDDSFFTKRLTVSNWKEEIKKNGEYNILSSNLNILSSVFPVVTVTSLVLFFAYKIFGENYVNSNTILLILIIQTPFNTALGLNPLGLSIMRQNVSKHITQNDLKKYLGGANKRADFSSIPIRKINKGTPIVNINNIQKSSIFHKTSIDKMNIPNGMNNQQKKMR